MKKYLKYYNIIAFFALFYQSEKKFEVRNTTRYLAIFSQSFDRVLAGAKKLLF